VCRLLYKPDSKTIPEFQESTIRGIRSNQKLRSIREEHLTGIGAALESEIGKHEAEKAGKGLDSGLHILIGDAKPYLEDEILKRGED
jgi:hypothetical protein